MTREAANKMLIRDLCALLVACLVFIVTATLTRGQDIDFNNDGQYPDTLDRDDFLRVFSGGDCYTCDTIDFNRDGLFPDTQDVDDFLAAFAGSEVGWTAVPPLPLGAREIYLDPLNGSEDNTGLSRSSPTRRWAVAWSMVRDDAGDRIILMNDLNCDAASGAVNGLSMYHKSNFIIMGDPLRATRPVIRGPSSGSTIHLGGSQANNVWLLDLDIRGGFKGISSFVTGRGWLIEGCSITGAAVGLSLETETPGTTRDVRIRRCVIADNQSTSSHSQGIYTGGIFNVWVEDCVLDHNGRGYPGDAGTMFNHNWYCNSLTDWAKVTNTISARASATGLQMRCNHVEVNGCLVLDSPLGITLGHDDYGSQYPTRYVTGSVVGCAVLGTADISSELVRSGPAYGFGYAKNVLLSGNIAAQGTARTAAIRTDRPSSGVQVLGNYVWDWNGAPAFEVAGTAQPMSVGITTTRRFPTLSDYLGAQGETDTSTARFLELARQNRRGHWDVRWTARAVIEWIKTH